MPFLDTPDSNIFWYALTQNNEELSKHSIEYFNHIKLGNGVLLESIEEEIDSFLHKKIPYIQTFLIFHQKIGGISLEKELEELPSRKGLDEKERIVLENLNIVKYIYAKVGRDIDFSTNIHDIIRKDMNKLIELFESRIIPSLDRYSDNVLNEIEELNSLGLENRLDALHMVNFFVHLQNRNRDGIFLTYDKADFSFSEKLQSKLWRIKVLAAKVFLDSKQKKEMG